MSPGAASDPLDEAVDHLLAAGLLEVDGQFVAVDSGDASVTELLMEDALPNSSPEPSAVLAATSVPSIVIGSRRGPLPERCRFARARCQPGVS